MAGFSRSIVSSLPLDEQWLLHLQGHPLPDDPPDADPTTIQTLQDGILRCLSFFSRRLSQSLEPDPTAHDHTDSGQSRISGRQLSLLQSAFYESAFSEGAFAEDAFSEDIFSEDALSEGALSEGASAEDALSEGASAEDAFYESALSENAFSEGASAEDAFSEGASEEGTGLARTLESGPDALEAPLREAFTEVASQLQAVSQAPIPGTARPDPAAWLRLQTQRIAAALRFNRENPAPAPDTPRTEYRKRLHKGLTAFRDASTHPESYSVALYHLEAALSARKSDCIALYHLGLIHLCTPQHLDLAAAAKLLWEAASYAIEEGDSPWAELLGLLCADPTEPSETEDPGRKAHERFAAEAYTRAALCHYLQGKPGTALRLFDNALELAPDDAQVQVWKLRCLFLVGCGAEAGKPLRRLIEADPGFGLWLALDPDFAASTDVQRLFASMRDEAVTQLRAMLDVCVPFLTPQSVAADLVATLGGLIDQNSYLDSVKGISLLSEWRSPLAGSDLALPDFLRREQEILTELLPALRVKIEALPPQEGLLAGLVSRMLELLSPPSAAGFVAAETMLSSFCQVFDRIISLQTRAAEDSDLARLLAGLEKNLLPGGRTEGFMIVGSTLIRGDILTILAGLESWMDAEEAVLRTRAEATRKAVYAQQYRDYLAVKEYRRRALHAAQAHLQLMDGEVARAKAECLEAADPAQPYPGSGFPETFAGRVGRLEALRSQAALRVLHEERQKLEAPTLSTLLGSLKPGLAIPVISSFVDPVYVEGGNFRMIQDQEEKQPGPSVTLSSYYIERYPVTQGQFRVVMGWNPSSRTGGPDAEYHPVQHLSWIDSIEFCNRLSIMAGLEPVYSITARTPATGHPVESATVSTDMSKNGYRLPTEAEWEYAARGGKHSSGSLFAGSDDVGAVAWYTENSDDSTHPVGTKAPNELGLHDMSGNVWECCWSGETVGFSRCPEYSSPSREPCTVFRGGSYYHLPTSSCGISARVPVPLSDYRRFLGFRILRRA